MSSIKLLGDVCDTSGMGSNLVAEACDLELRLLDPLLRSQRSLVDEVLHDDFVEYGFSGRRWTKAEVVAALSSEGDPTPVVTSELNGSLLSDHIVLVTYRSVRGDRQAWRSSIWIRETGRCQVLFHQATPITPTNEA